MSAERLWAIRGATTVEADTPSDIAQRTTELLDQILDLNNLTADKIVSIFFSTTPDVTSAFPATSARHGGFGEVALMCFQEIPVPGALSHCIRVMLHVSTERDRSELTHVYLHGAEGLRNDLKR
jgi:chorismate mutase